MTEMLRESPYAMVPIEVAHTLIMDRVTPLGSEEVDTLAADGRVLAQPIFAAEAVPDLPKAAMDGYAMRASDGLSPRRVVAELTAGGSSGLALGPGMATRIMTGTPLPAGADAVIPVEQSEEHEGLVQVLRAVKSGDYVHQVGQDIARGTCVLTPGMLIGPEAIALLASLGVTRVTVYRRVRVAVLATGDEVFEPGTPRPPGSVYDANRFALLAAVREAGAEPISLGIARDSYEAQHAAITHGLQQADLLISSGGVSMGSRDLIKPLLATLGTIHFGRIAFKPGKPTTFATIGEQLVFALPGNPVSALVSFEVFVRPALRALQGDRRPWRPRARVRLATPIQPADDRPEYQRVHVCLAGAALEAYSTGEQGSSRLISLRGANGLLLVPPGERPYPVGTELEALLTGPLQTAPPISPGASPLGYSI